MAPIGFSARCAAETGCLNYSQKQKSIGRTRKDEVWLWVYPRNECCDTGAYRDASSPKIGRCRMEVTKHYRVGRRSAADRVYAPVQGHVVLEAPTSEANLPQRLERAYFGHQSHALVGSVTS